ncbi:hypothetical protein ACPEIF_08705 [Streptomyces sp. NPDC012600]|uniref:Uncharacterized protein n=1 Tax=Streptomyces stephensoniae TaxID=3375367 RepID=A0ABU2VV88_9ACTN|nr:hypothetical protein [Streptomyces griseus]MDT0489531.1 hypothetical protein [Streptomyces griseus]
MGVPVVLGIAAGAATTLVTDRSWSSELLPRCLMFSITYMAIQPVMVRVRRRAERQERQHLRDIEQARRDRRI